MKFNRFLSIESGDISDKHVIKNPGTESKNDDRLPSTGKILSNAIKKREWTKEEEEKLDEAIKIYPAGLRGRWTLIARHVGRSYNSCYLKWHRQINPKISHGRWTVEEKIMFNEAVQICGFGNWSKIATAMGGSRTPDQVRARAFRHTRPLMGKWTKDEDDSLKEAVVKYQYLIEKYSNSYMWRAVSSHVKTRDFRQCRQRYLTLANGSNKRSPWTAEEIDLLENLCAKLGHKWLEISKHFPGRSCRTIAAKWHSLNRYYRIYEK